MESRLYKTISIFFFLVLNERRLVFFFVAQRIVFIYTYMGLGIPMKKSKKNKSKLWLCPNESAS